MLAFVLDRGETTGVWSSSARQQRRKGRQRALLGKPRATVLLALWRLLLSLSLWLGGTLGDCPSCVRKRF